MPGDRGQKTLALIECPLASGGPPNPSPAIVTFLLASASPRRAELLRAAGLSFEVRVAAVDEAVLPGESPEVYVRRVAEAKAGAVARLDPTTPVIGADTAVVVDGQILGKPGDHDDAARMLRLLSGRSHQVLTGVCLVAARGGVEITRLAQTTVEFAPLSPDELDWYVASGEPLDKAGAYAIQGLASRFIERIDGSYSNVVGLPVALLYRMCAEAGMLIS
jgi:septum formation protein